MAWLWILGILLALIVLVLLIRVGVYISFGEELRVRAKAGPVTIQILPKPEKKPKKKKKPKKEKKKPEKKEKKPAEKPKKKRLTFEDIRSAVPALFESLKKGLRKTRRRLKIDPMRLSVSFGGDDPSKVAQMYGWSDTAMWTFMPHIEELTRMPDPRIHLDADYERGKTEAAGEIGISLQIRDIFAIGFAFAGPLLKWGLAFLKRKKARDAAARKAANEEETTVEDMSNTTHQDKGE